MKKNAKAKLPRFKSEKEEAEFWATHDSVDYWREFEEVREPLEFDPKLARAIDRRSRKKELISIRLEKWQIRLARAIAARQRIPYHTIIRAWVTEGIRAKRATL
ncbi:MAG: hypothetical protein HYY16_19465 [Planctomycetes bacterium]|nr:hypothetical protein [Planctomycetota bacterium]